MSKPEQSEPERLPSTSTSERAELRHLVLEGPNVEDFLCQLAEIATEIAPGTHCSFMLEHDAQPISVAATDAVASALDEVQRLHGDGPAHLAMRTGAQVDAPALADDDRWIELGTYAAACGVGSGVFLPLRVDGDALGVLSVYAAGPAGLVEDGVRRARLIADEAAAGVFAALRRFSAVPDDQLRRALATRRKIDQALGVLMHAGQVNSRAALGTLLDLARTWDRSPAEAAARVLENAAREQGSADGLT